MAIERIVTPEKYIGLSTDTKPTHCRTGATFYETDTDRLYIAQAEGATWTLKKEATNEDAWTFGKPTLRTGGAGIASWGKAYLLGQNQKGHSGILANLYGGAQSGDDWAACYVPTNELPVTSFETAQWAWYQTAAESMGLGIVIWIHDPTDFDKRAEVTQVGGAAGLDKSAGWNSHEFNPATTQMFFYGENISGNTTCTTAGTQYSWNQFQADALFSTWAIYRVSFDWGWEASGTFESAWLADVKLNGQIILLDPSFVEFDLTTGIGHGRGTCASAGTANQITTTTTPCQWIEFTAETDNTGAVVLGGSGVDETLASRTGKPLLAGDSFLMKIDDVSKVYIDSNVTGDGVNYIFGW